MSTSLEDFLIAEGYEGLQTIDGQLVGLHRFIFTVAIVVGLDRDGYKARYCYPAWVDAFYALKDWAGKETPEPEGYIVKK